MRKKSVSVSIVSENNWTAAVLLNLSCLRCLWNSDISEASRVRFVYYMDSRTRLERFQWKGALGLFAGTVEIFDKVLVKHVSSFSVSSTLRRSSQLYELIIHVRRGQGVVCGLLTAC